MSEFVAFILLEVIFNFVGAAVRWTFGSLYRTLSNKPKFTFKEYLNGPKKPGWFDEQAHGTNNVIVGVVSTLAIIVLLVVVI
ncbi:hypothetical protein LB467_18250 [Salegentibacter sp. JZCK2]|uniref:hypothetical protein n=1 Tax=Salegentibacter tibetensis TaxID=2873600 RepID=UPI001CCB165A|nr:hypothetical protein [Salegentibacter tibetensis]MBZ9731632.1 hypothetical protein [Salegentibacter tibetensis]